MSTHFRTSLLGILSGIPILICSEDPFAELLTAAVTGYIPNYSKEIGLSVLDEIAAIYYISGEIDSIFKRRVATDQSKIFASNDVLFKCIPSHYSCEECKGNRKKIRDIYKGTLLELLCHEEVAIAVGDDPMSYPFLYDFLILIGNVKNNKTKNLRNTNLLITNIDHFLCKENMFMIDILVSNYGLCFISANNWYLNNTQLISDRFVTLLLLEYNFDTKIIDTVMASFDVDIDFVFNMFVSKFNLEKETFSYAPIPDILDCLYKCLLYLYKKTEVTERKDFIIRVCNSFAENIVSTTMKWKFLDVVIAIQESEETPQGSLIIPIIYDDLPEDGYTIGKYFGTPNPKTRYDIIETETFVFASNLHPVDENKRVVEIYELIKNEKHPYLSFKYKDFSLSRLRSCRSNLVFHIYCEMSVNKSL